MIFLKSLRLDKSFPKRIRITLFTMSDNIALLNQLRNPNLSQSECEEILDQLENLMQQPMTQSYSEEDFGIFHDNQIACADKLKQNILEGTRYNILLAQMQSGKTGTYMYLICDLIKDNIIDQAFIITGTSDTALREQCKEDKNEDINDYMNIIFRNRTREDRQFWKAKFKSSIQIKWPQELFKDSSQIKNKTLIVWDESHFAQNGDGSQSTSNRPYKFLKDHNLHQCLWGDESELNIRDCYFLSVSATPFSELVNNLTDNIRENNRRLVEADMKEITKKKVVKLQPGTGYRSLGWYLENQLFKSSFPIDNSNRIELKYILKSHIQRDNPKYFIIRTRDNSRLAFQPTDIIKEIAQELDIAVKEYYGDKDNLSISGNETRQGMDALNDVPNKPTIVIIKGKCRMGKVVPKANVGFVFESSSSIKVDTALQGLPGRMCGYSSEVDNFSDNKIEIYVSPKIIPEINNYINAFENYGIPLCSNAMNVPKQSRRLNQIGRTVPVRFPREIFGDLYDTVDINNREELRAALRIILGRILEHRNKITELNNHEQSRGVIDKIQGYLSDVDNEFEEIKPYILDGVRHIRPGGQEPYNMYEDLTQNYENETTMQSRYTNCNKYIHIAYTIDNLTDFGGNPELFQLGDVWLWAKTEAIPITLKTTKKEGFSPCIPIDDEIAESTIVQLCVDMSIRDESENDPEIFKTDLEDIIKSTIHREPTYIKILKRKISATLNLENQKYKYLRLNKIKYDDGNKLDEIKRELDRKYGIQLNFEKNNVTIFQHIEIRKITW